MWRWLLSTIFTLCFCLGTSYITIPFSVSSAGLWPAALAVGCAWLYLLITGYYYLTATLSCPRGANVHTISQRFLGPIGSWISTAIFICVQYGYLIFFFYLARPILSSLLTSWGVPFSPTLALFFLAILLGCLLSKKQYTLYATLCCFVAILFLVALCFSAALPFATPEERQEPRWLFLLVVFPTLVNSLYYCTLLPSLARLLHYDRKQIIWSMATAVTCAALFFFSWLWLSSTAIGAGPTSLTTLNPETISFSRLQQVPFFGRRLPLLLSLLIFGTSLGVGTVLLDLWRDLSRSFSRVSRFYRIAWVLLPPTLLNLIPLKWLYVAALYITDIGPLYLAGLLPCLWIWALLSPSSPSQPSLLGGKKGLALTTLISCCIFYLVGLSLFYEENY